LSIGTISKVHNKTYKEWYRVKGYAETVAHEFIIHAMRRILGELRTEYVKVGDTEIKVDLDHKHFFTDNSDPDNPIIYEDAYSPNEQYLLQVAKKSIWTEFYRQLNKVIDKKYPKNNRIKYD